jgi:hypothetical protein
LCINYSVEIAIFYIQNIITAIIIPTATTAAATAITQKKLEEI